MDSKMPVGEGMRQDQVELEDVKDMEDEKSLDIGDEPSRDLKTYFDTPEQHKDCQKLILRCPVSKTENGKQVPYKIYDALKQIQRLGKDGKPAEELVAESGTTYCCCCETVVNQGQIGLATKFGETYFLPPGTYWWLGWGVSLDRVQDVEDSGVAGTDLVWKDVTWLNVSDSNVAVVQVGKKQLILGSGRYLLRAPARLVGNRVHLQKLANKGTVKQYTEEAGVPLPGQDPRDVPDKVTEKVVVSGAYQDCGAITFVRAEPGFCYVIQNVYGQLRTGIGMTVCRGGEVFLEFVDRQNYARTTRTFCLESSDRQEVRIRVQLKWRIENAKLWITRKGASADIFDAIEEISESMLRDAIASHSYEECHEQATQGYENIEKQVRGGLEMQCRALGGVLLGFEIRSLRFPLLERRNLNRAMQEAKFNEDILEEKRQLGVAIEAWKRADAELEYKQRKEREKVTHDAKMQVLRDSEDLKKMEKKAELDLAQQNFDIDKKLIVLDAQKQQQILSLKQNQDRVASQVKRELVDATGTADAQIQDAKAEAESVRQKSAAQAAAKLNLAESDAKAAALIGSAYRDNAAYMQLQIARMNAQVQEARAKAMAAAVDHNNLTMLPASLQKELSSFNTIALSE